MSEKVILVIIRAMSLLLVTVLLYPIAAYSEYHDLD